MSYLTIPGFENMSRQELFNASARHLLRTGKKSCLPDDGSCCYQGSGCAAAPFLAPGNHAIADTAVVLPTWKVLATNNLVPPHEVEFVGALQRCHDTAAVEAFMPQWGYEMRQLADDWGLDASILDEEM